MGSWLLLRYWRWPGGWHSPSLRRGHDEWSRRWHAEHRVLGVVLVEAKPIGLFVVIVAHVPVECMLVPAQVVCILLFINVPLVRARLNSRQVKWHRKDLLLGQSLFSLSLTGFVFEVGTCPSVLKRMFHFFSTSSS